MKGFRFILLLMLAATPLRAEIDWPAAHRTPGNLAVRPAAAQPIALTAGPAWQTPDLALADIANATIADPFVYVPADLEDGQTTPALVLAFDAFTGQLTWQSPPLEPRIFGSGASAVLDPTGAALYYPSGSTVYKLSTADGTIDWATPLSADNTTSGPGLFWLINSSPQLGDGKVFVETYGGFSAADKQLVALDAATGAVLWSVFDGGQGTVTPIVDQGRVYTGVRNGVRCYATADGAPLWHSATDTPTTWTTAPWVLFGSPTLSDGKLYIATGDPAFAATTTTLVCADAVTGARLWQVDSLHSDCPPIVMNGRVYVYGGGFPGRLACFDAATGAPVFNRVIAPFSFIFRNYPAASGDRIYATDGDRLMALNPADGAVLDSIAGGFTGPVSIDRLGGLYAHATGNGASLLKAFGQTVPVELSRFHIE